MMITNSVSPNSSNWNLVEIRKDEKRYYQLRDISNKVFNNIFLSKKKNAKKVL